MQKYKRFISSLILGGFLSLIPTTVYAHDGSNVPFGGFLAGLVHPVLGYDHFLAMLSVGILSAQIGGRAIWTVPAAFCSGGSWDNPGALARQGRHSAPHRPPATRRFHSPATAWMWPLGGLL